MVASRQRSYQSALSLLSSLIRAPTAAAPATATAATTTASTRYVDGFTAALEVALPRAGLTQVDMARLRVVHVAGTKGKGSTCCMVERILREAGYTTGLFTSPHLLDVTERVRLGGVPISREVFTRHFWSLWDDLSAPSSSSSPASGDAASASDGQEKEKPRDGDDAARSVLGGDGMPGYFRFLTLLSLRVFLEAKVDVAILEVGLGGRLDATNVVARPVVSGVALIDYDHCEILGNTLREIATEKAGIFKEVAPGITLQSPPQPEEAAVALRAEAARRKTALETAPSLDEYDNGDAVRIGLEGAHQRVNAALAVALSAKWMRVVSQADTADDVRDTHDARSEKSRRYADMILGDGSSGGASTKTLPEVVLHGLHRASWPGRCQVVMRGKTAICLDGAHTPESIKACAAWFAERCGEKTRKRVLLFHCMEKRDPVQLMAPLAELHERVDFELALFVPRTSHIHIYCTLSLTVHAHIRVRGSSD